MVVVIRCQLTSLWAANPCVRLVIIVLQHRAPSPSGAPPRGGCASQIILQIAVQLQTIPGFRLLAVLQPISA
jgi:hypothetical protein